MALTQEELYRKNLAYLSGATGSGPSSDTADVPEDLYRKNLAYLLQNEPKQEQVKPVEQPDTDYGALQAMQNFLYESATGAGRMAQDVGLESIGNAVREFGEKGVARNPVGGDLLGGLTDEGNILGAGGTATGITELLGQMAPLLAGGALGAKMGVPLGLPGVIGGGTIGTLLSMLPSSYEDQAKRQEEVRGGEFEPTTADKLKRLGAGVSEGLIESLGGPQRVLYSGIIKSLAKRGVKDFSNDIVAKIAKEARPDAMGVWKYRGKKALDSALTEAVEENLQSLTQRGIAGQDLTSPDAIEEYKYGTVGGLIGGGLLGGALARSTSQDEVTKPYWPRLPSPEEVTGQTGKISSQVIADLTEAAKLPEAQFPGVAAKAQEFIRKYQEATQEASAVASGQAEPFPQRGAPAVDPEGGFKPNTADVLFEARKWMRETIAPQKAEETQATQKPTEAIELPKVRNTKNNRAKAISMLKQVMDNSSLPLNTREQAEANIITLQENKDATVVKTILGQIEQLRKQEEANADKVASPETVVTQEQTETSEGVGEENAEGQTAPEESEAEKSIAKEAEEIKTGTPIAAEIPDKQEKTAPARSVYETEADREIGEQEDMDAVIEAMRVLTETDRGKIAKVAANPNIKHKLGTEEHAIASALNTLATSKTSTASVVRPADIPKDLTPENVDTFRKSLEEKRDALKETATPLDDASQADLKILEDRIDKLDLYVQQKKELSTSEADLVAAKRALKEYEKASRQDTSEGKKLEVRRRKRDIADMVKDLERQRKAVSGYESAGYYDKNAETQSEAAKAAYDFLESEGITEFADAIYRGYNEAVDKTHERADTTDAQKLAGEIKNLEELIKLQEEKISKIPDSRKSQIAKGVKRLGELQGTLEKIRSDLQKAQKSAEETAPKKRTKNVASKVEPKFSDTDTVVGKEVAAKDRAFAENDIKRKALSRRLEELNQIESAEQKVPQTKTKKGEPKQKPKTYLQQHLDNVDAAVKELQESTDPRLAETDAQAKVGKQLVKAEEKLAPLKADYIEKQRIADKAMRAPMTAENMLHMRETQKAATEAAKKFNKQNRVVKKLRSQVGLRERAIAAIKHRNLGPEVASREAVDVEQILQEVTKTHNLLPSINRSGKRGSVEGVKKAVQEAFGEIEPDNLHVYSSRTAAIKKLAANRGITFEEANDLVDPNASAFYDEATGEIYMDASSIPPEFAAGVLLHETVHDKLRSDKDIAPQYAELIQRGVALFNGPSTVAARARARATEANTQEAEEKLAYLIEEAQNERVRVPPSITRWLSDLLSKFKVWLNELGVLNPKYLTVNDIRVMFSNKLRETNMPKRLNKAEKMAGRILNSVDGFITENQNKIPDLMYKQKEKNAPDAPTLESTGTLVSDLFVLLPGAIQKPIVEGIRRATRWLDDRVLNPLHISAEKNPFAVLTKGLLKDRDSVTQANLNYMSQFYKDLERSGLPKEQIDKAAEIVRAISENNLMYNYFNEEEVNKLRDEFRETVAPAIENIAETITDTRAIVNLLEDTGSTSENAKIVNNYIDDMFNRALSLQPDFSKGIVRTQLGKEDAVTGERRPTGHPQEITFKYPPKDMEKIARDIHRVIGRTAIAVAVSRYSKFNEIRLSQLQGLANLLKLPHGISESGPMRTLKNNMKNLADTYSDVFEQDQTAAKVMMKHIKAYAALETQAERVKYSGSEGFENVRNDINNILSMLKNKEQRDTFAKEIEPRLTHLHMAGADASSYFDRSFQTIANFYIPHQRLGKHLASVQYRDRSGKYVSLDNDVYPAMVVDFDYEVDVNEFVKNFNDDMDDVWLTVRKKNKGTGEEYDIEVKMVATTTRRDYRSYVPQEAGDLDFDRISRIFDQAKVNLSSEQTSNLVSHMFLSLRKKRLAPYRAAIGFRYKDSLQSIADYLNGSAYVISANYFDHRIDSLLQMDNWKSGRILARISNLEEHIPYAEGTLLKQQEQELAQLKRYYELAKEHDRDVGNIQDLMRESVYKRRAEAGQGQTKFDELSRSAMRWTTVATLGFNISTAITQVVTLPIVIPAYLAQNYGYLNAEYRLFANTLWLLKSGIFSSLTKTPAEIMQKRVEQLKKDDPGRKEFWDHVALQMREGRLQIGQVLAVTGTAHEGIKLGSASLRKVADVAMQPFALSEALVRTATFMTAYDLEVAKQRKTSKGKFQLTEDIFSNAIEIGDKAVELTQGEYADWARAPALQDKHIRPFTMFWHYPQVQIALVRQLLKDDKRSAMLYVAGLFLVAGADGFPFSELLKGIIDMLAKEFPQLFGQFGSKAFDGNVRNFLREEIAAPIENGLSELTGRDFTEAVSKGLASNLLGVDLSFKMGLGAPYGNMSGHHVTDLLGPVGSVGKLTFDAASELKNGLMDLAGGYDPSQAFKKMMLKMPVSAVRNAYKGLVIGDKGYYPTREGLAVTDTSLDAVDAIVQALGWMPLEAGSQYSQADVMQRYLNMQREMTADVNALAGQFLRDGEHENYRELAKRVRERNRLWREMGSPLKVNWTPSQHRKRAQTGEMTVTRRTEEKVPKNLKRLDLHGY